MTSTELHKRSKDAMYAALNARFDERAEWLRSRGYRYEHLPEYGIAVFIKGTKGNKPHTIQTGTVSNANEEVWLDMIQQVLDRMPLNPNNS